MALQEALDLLQPSLYLPRGKMHILGDAWRDGYLDEALSPGHVRIQPSVWRTLAPVEGLYFVRPRDPRVVFNYLFDIGIRATLRKIASRSREALRNQKFVSCGSGTILAAGPGSSRRVGQSVIFVAPAHPRCMERIVLPDLLTHEAQGPSPAAADSLTYLGGDDLPPAPWVAAVSGWSAHSGARLPETALRAAFDSIPELLKASGRRSQRLHTHPQGPEERRASSRRQEKGRPTAILFGLGNYAKTVVLPSIEPHVRVTAIHEIDPAQIGRDPRPAGRIYDSAPFLREDEACDAVFVAGFHHGHSALGVAALQIGAAAVIEKPIVTTREQLAALEGAMAATNGRVFACFQRRHLQFNDWAREDLAAPVGTPISYHATVYEVPLPALHWYRWPNSGSRVLSNGCHWIDHFLFLNQFSPVRRREMFRATDGTVNVSLELANEAVFTMTLTERGSSRLGVQDHVELRTAEGTASITNASHYLAERGTRRLRRASLNKMSAYHRMYRSIARALASRAPGDSLRTIGVTCRAVLDLEDAFREASCGS